MSLFKKDVKKNLGKFKSSYIPASIVCNVSKQSEKSMIFSNNFSKYQFGFRKNYSVQQCFFALAKFCEMTVDNKEAFGALFTDLFY